VAILLFSFGVVSAIMVMLAGLEKNHIKPVFIAAPFMFFMAAAVARYLGL